MVAESQKIWWFVRYLVRDKIGYDVGCGGWSIPGAIGIDIKKDSAADLICDCSMSNMWTFANNKGFHTPVDYVFSSHLIENFDEEQQICICGYWLDAIQTGGLLILYVPEKGAFKGTNVNHVREFRRGDLEALYEKLGFKQYLITYETDVYPNMYGIIGVGERTW